MTNKKYHYTIVGLIIAIAILIGTLVGACLDVADKTDQLQTLSEQTKILQDVTNQKSCY